MRKIRVAVIGLGSNGGQYARLYAEIVGDKLSRLDKPGELFDLPFETPKGHPYDPEVGAFLKCIVEDVPPPITARDGGNTAIGILSAIEALHAKRAIRVPVVR